MSLIWEAAMLVLARGTGQSVVLDDRITVTVLATRGGTVRLGIDAPTEVVVRRGELDPVARVIDVSASGAPTSVPSAP